MRNFLAQFVEELKSSREGVCKKLNTQWIAHQRLRPTGNVQSEPPLIFHPSALQIKQNALTRLYLVQTISINNQGNGCIWKHKREALMNPTTKTSLNASRSTVTTLQHVILSKTQIDQHPHNSFCSGRYASCLFGVLGICSEMERCHLSRQSVSKLLGSVGPEISKVFLFYSAA